MISRTLLIAVLVTTSASAQTQSQVERRYTRSYNQCIEASNGGDYELTKCTDSEIERQDGRINQAYVMVMRSLPQPKMDALRKLERTWIKQRDVRCEARAEPESGGTLYNVIYSSCILDETIKRTIFLENYKG